MISILFPLPKNNSLVIAEGVQSREEMDTVISLGVDYLQGYYVGVPSLTSQPIPDKIFEGDYQPEPIAKRLGALPTPGEA